MQTVIYLDNNATTKIDPRVLEAIMPFLTDEYSNAASTHLFGVKAYDAVKKARLEVAELIGAETNEIVFTSGATEAINLAIKGIAENYSQKGKHIITCSTEHSAVLDTCHYLESKGYEITYLPVEKDGLLDIENVKKALRKDTTLLSIMLVNNETGIIQDVKSLSELAHNKGAIFMTDATQAIGKLEIDADKMGIDILCMSGHKLYAPKGIGALYIRQRGNRIKLPALIHGGGHERGMRSGTLNVPAIVGLGAACKIAKQEMEKNEKSLRELRDYLETNLLKIENTTVNGNAEQRLYNVSNLCFNGADSEAIIMGLSNQADNSYIIAVSNGSACTSTSIEPSHVLTGMGISEQSSFNSIRFSLGKYNTRAEIDIVIDKVKRVVSELRAMV